MNKKITFRHMEHSPVIEEHANNQLKKVEKFLAESEREPISINLVLNAQYTHHHHGAELLVNTPHYDLRTNAEMPDMYKAIDKVIDTMYELLREKKRERIEKQHTGGTKRVIED